MGLSKLVFGCQIACLLLSAARADGANMTLSLASGTLWHGDTGRQWYGSVTLVVPFDAFTAPPVVLDVSQSGDTPETPGSETRGHEDGSAPQPGGGTKRNVAPPIEAPADLLLARALVFHALRVAGHSSARQRLFSLSTRARTSALLPELRLAGGRSSDAVLRLTPTLSDPDRYTQSGGTDLWAEARLIFRLDRLVFADDEIAIERLIEDREQAAIRLSSRVLEVFFAWHRARVDSADATRLPEEQLAAQLAAIEAQVTLDVLTDGWFSKQLIRMRRRR